MNSARPEHQPDSPLPRTIEPIKLVEQRVDLAGYIGLDRFDRLADTLLSNDGKVAVALRFDVDPQGVKFMAGTATATISQQCQRCLQPMQQPVNSDVSWGLVFSEEAAKQLPRHYDPLILDGPELDVWAVIEDELMLSLPIVAYHPAEQCESSGRYTSGEEISVEPADNPFAVLASLKQTDS